jgi:RNA ligase (TIGR02306 family)
VALPLSELRREEEAVERKLASIQRVESIAPIAGADKIVKARVMGWDVVVKKGELAAGDACVFFEIDAILPNGPSWAEFMRVRGFRLKTMRLRGVLSQGLALPVSILPEGTPIEIGRDVSSLLGVTKHEPVLPDTREIAGPFPTRVPKTDEIRLQSALAVLDEIRGRPFVITTKLDGSSITYLRESETDFVACSRNWALARSEGTSAWRVANELGLERTLPVGLALQGELCGPGIQKNRLGLAKAGFFAFSAYDVRAARYLAHDALVALCHELGVPTVPVERRVEGDEAARFEHSLERYLELARGLYTGTNNRKEGIVVRPLEEARSEALGGRLSFKVISNEFLLEDED